MTLRTHTVEKKNPKNNRMKQVFTNLIYLNKFAQKLRDARFRKLRINNKKLYSRKNGLLKYQHTDDLR